MKLHNLIHILIGILCIVLLPVTQAVTPPPNGGYPNFTTAEGQKALFSLTTGSANTAVGWFSLFSNSAGSFNTATGAGALLFNTADQNTAIGTAALLSNSVGPGNTAVGVSALVNNTNGGGNVAVGVSALVNATGHNNTALGTTAGVGVTTASNVTCIGAAGQNVDNSCYIGGIAGQTVGVGGNTCYVDNDGKLGVFLSSRRFKTNIADMGAASEALLALRPVTFQYKAELDKTGIPQFGLVAEEVTKVNPDLVTHDAKGDISTVRYEAVNVMLLNEFLKEHRKVEKQEATIVQVKSNAAKQEATITELTSGMQALTATVKEQAAQIQKVSAQLEASKPASQVVNNP